MGAWICVPQEGQGPVTPAKEPGTVSLMSQAGQWKVIERVDILCEGYREKSEARQFFRNRNQLMFEASGGRKYGWEGMRLGRWVF
jgi:hypothetical protein